MQQSKCNAGTLIGLKIYRKTNLFNADTKEPEPSVRLRQVCIDVGVVISFVIFGTKKSDFVDLSLWRRYYELWK